MMAEKIHEPDPQREDLDGGDADDKQETIESKDANPGGPSKSDQKVDPVAQSNHNESEDEELEEGELKDDDDDDDDEDDDVQKKEGDVVDGARKSTGLGSDESDTENRKRSSSSESRKSCGKDSSKSSVRSGGINSRRGKLDTLSTRSSSSSIDRIHKPLSFSSRRESIGRHSSRSNSRSRRRLSPSNESSPARLVTMRAQLLEAKSREIEMKFQKNKIRVPRPTTPLSTLPSTLSIKNIKTTVAKPHITYSENPDPLESDSEIKRESKSSKASKRESKDRSKSSKKSSKKRKKKSSSSSKKKKRTKTSDSPRKGDSSEKNSTQATVTVDDALDRVGPKTPPDNLVLTLDDVQVEWPSYLIKMTSTQPSISYSVNPDSVAANNITSDIDTSDLNAEYSWYYNYFMDSFDMDRVQAQNQAYSVLLSVSRHDKDLIEHWLEQQGFSKQSDVELDNRLQQDKDLSPKGRDPAPIPLRATQPTVTTLRSDREIVLPNGKVLPRGTVQKIVHPYPKTRRITPELALANLDLC